MYQLALAVGFTVACLACLGHGRRSQPWALRSRRHSNTGSQKRLKAFRPAATSHRDQNVGKLLDLHGGDAEPTDALLKTMYACDELVDVLMSQASVEVAGLREIVEDGEVIPNFGKIVEQILDSLLDTFDAETPQGKDDEAMMYEEKRGELLATLLKSFEPVFAQQVRLLVGAALERFKKGLHDGIDSSEALAAAEAWFVREARSSVPRNTGFAFKLECASLLGAMRTILTEQKKAQKSTLESTEHMQTVASYLEMQAEQMRTLEADFPTQMNWDVGVAYRPPDTDINFSGTYKPGEGNPTVQIAMADSGDGGQFSNGVGPANIGLSCTIHT